MLSVKTLYQNFLQSPDNDQFSRAATTLLTSLTRSAELVGQRRSRTSTFHTPAESHAALLTTSLTGQDTAPIIVLVQPTPSQHSYSETGDTKELIACLLDSYQKRCQTVEKH